MFIMMPGRKNKVRKQTTKNTQVTFWVALAVLNTTVNTKHNKVKIGTNLILYQHPCLQLIKDI